MTLFMGFLEREHLRLKRFWNSYDRPTKLFIYERKGKYSKPWAFSGITVTSDKPFLLITWSYVFDGSFKIIHIWEYKTNNNNC